MPFAPVILSGDGPQVDDLQVLPQGEHHLVDVGELIALGVHAEVVGLRSSTQVAVFLPCVVRHGEITGSSGFIPQSALNLSRLTQLSNLPSLTFLSSSSLETYLGWNCFR
jgi:hypothetical protein